MVPRKSVLFVGAGVLIAGVWIYTARESGESAGSEKPTVVAKAEEKLAPTRPSEKPAAKVAAKPEVYFLEEAAAQEATARPMANHARKANGTRRISGVRAVTSPDDGEFMAPRWSPDGLELLFSKPGYEGLFARGVHGGEITRITDKPGVGYSAEWTEDGRIVVKSDQGTQVYNPDGTPAGADGVPMASAGAGEVYSENDTVYYRANPGEEAVAISSGSDKYYGGKISPDGKHVVYNGLETGIYVKPLDGSGPEVHIGYGTEPTFLPDGSGIVYTVSHDDGYNLVAGDLYMATLDGSTISDLTGGSSAIETKPNVSPDGTQIAFESDGVLYVGQIQ